MPRPSARHKLLTLAVTDWFSAAARDLPWRAQRDPYRALVSEFMLQQTQVSRVLEKFEPFIRRFPTVDALADATEDDVLSAWSGLGYYRRARMLHAAARAVRDEFQSRVPRDVLDLRSLPGVGRYTAGAIASIVFDRPEPVVDGNVVRVLQRVEAHRGTPDQAWAWKQAETLVHVADRPGPFNEGLMELGATICTPARPRCDACPLAKLCRARARGLENSIPQPGQRTRRTLLYATAVVATDARSRILIERRPAAGLWASMWQCPTIERDDGFADPDQLASAIGASTIQPIGSFTFLTTHRDVRFAVYRAAGARAGAGRIWLAPSALDTRAVSNAQRRVLKLAGVGVSCAVSSTP